MRIDKAMNKSQDGTVKYKDNISISMAKIDKQGILCWLNDNDETIRPVPLNMIMLDHWFPCVYYTKEIIGYVNIYPTMVHTTKESADAKAIYGRLGEAIYIDHVYREEK